MSDSKNGHGGNGGGGKGRRGGEELRVVGKPFRKVDARAKCTGQTKFADDISLPRMLYCKILRSPEPHALIKKIDATRALELPGVKAVITGEDLPVPYGILPVSQDEHALCVGKVRMIGDPVAAVAAVDEDTAFEAMNLIEVEYERLQTITSIEEAVMVDEPRVHDYGERGNVHKQVHLEFGDLEQGFAEADHVREDVLFFEGNTHLPMEQHAAVAHFDPDEKLTLWSSTQTPHYVHRALAKTLGLPAAHIRVIATPNGGGFGGKSDPFNHEIAVAKLSMITRRPVKITLTREEVFYCHRGRHPVLMKVKTGVRADGSITAMDFESYLDGGAYGSYGVASTFYAGALQTVTYEVPRYRYKGLRAFTNKPPCGPKRGHGTPQPRFALEVHLDKIAEDLKLDPAEIRLNHLVKPYTVTANYLRIGSMGLGRCIEKVVEGADWKNKFSGWDREHRKLPEGKGIGLACSSYICGAGLPIYWNSMPHSGVQLGLDRQGGVRVQCGSTDIGQGSDSVLAYVVAEVLGIDPFDIRVVTADTDLTPVDLGSYSSRVTLMTGNAALQAAERARELLTLAVAEKLGVPGDNLTFADRRVFDVENPEVGVSFAEAVVLAESKFGTIGTVGSYTPPRSPEPLQGGGRRPLARLQLLGLRRRGGRGRGDRLRQSRARLDRARHRPLDQPDARHGAGRGRRLHGARRGADGGDGLPRQPQRRPQVPLDARIQEPDDSGDVRREDLPRRGRRPERPLRREGGRAGAAPARHARRRQRRLRRRRRPRR
jgi:4-hydroxybenzoyl-CoA reductase subunit alpha